LHKLLLQLGEPEEAAKVKIPTGKKVKQRLDKWWAELEPNCYYFEEEDDACQSPRPEPEEHWIEEPEQAEVSPLIAKYKFYTPLAYSKQDSVVAPLAGGKGMSGTIIEDTQDTR